jgi:hypothetical protein
MAIKTRFHLPQEETFQKKPTTDSLKITMEMHTRDISSSAVTQYMNSGGRVLL